MGYVPLYKLTDKMVNLVSEVSEKLAQLDDRNVLQARPHLRRNNKIKSLHSSLKIEANSLSLDQVRDVIDGRQVAGPADEVAEVKNAHLAYAQISSLDPFSIEELKRVHGVLTQGLMKESGKFRKGGEGVFDHGRCIFVAPPAKLVPQLVGQLFDWLKASWPKVHPLIASAVFHYEFVFIHPFADGNGRMARLWHTALLSKWKPIFEFIPIENQIVKHQEEYYAAIEAGHSSGESTVFVEFMLGLISLALDDLLDKADDFEEDISEYEKKLLSAMEYDVPYTAPALLKLLGLKSRDTLRNNYLRPALDHGSIIMTEPDKPKSKNQRYIKKINDGNTEYGFVDW